jgi:pimeloyl-ACP methyl ester carboxylesterase
MRSNLALVAGVPAAAAIATEKAMRRAGVRSGERVVFVGHSQGGAVANTLAESGRYNTQGLITVGAPVGNQPVAGHYPALRIEHQDDLVVELGGHTQPGQSIIVEAQSGADPGDVAQAHSRERYLDTARRVDQSELPELATWDASLPPVRPGEVSFFDAREVSARGEAAVGKTDQ